MTQSSHESKIIVLRGNSGSGKSSVARLLQAQITPHPLLIEHDHFRRKIIKEKEKDNEVINPELMLRTVEFGLKHGRNIIIEGILPASNYTRFFTDIMTLHPHQNYFFYFDVPFEETIKRHATKPNAHEFGEPEMRRWWKEHDFLPGIDEVIIGPETTAEETAASIRNRVNI